MARNARRLRRLALDDDAQSLVEFALLLPVLLYILMGIIQFGLIFNAYVTLSNAVREGAREASFYVYDGSQSLTWNDTERLKKLMTATVNARGILNMGSAWNVGTTNFRHPGSWNNVSACSTNAGCTTTDSDVTVTFTVPADVTTNDPRRGYQMSLTAYYHEQLFVPLLDQFLPDDPDSGYAASWLRIPGRITVVIN